MFKNNDFDTEPVGLMVSLNFIPYLLHNFTWFDSKQKFLKLNYFSFTTGAKTFGATTSAKGSLCVQNLISLSLKSKLNRVD